MTLRWQSTHLGHVSQQCHDGDKGRTPLGRAGWENMYRVIGATLQHKTIYLHANEKHKITS